MGSIQKWEKRSTAKVSHFHPNYMIQYPNIYELIAMLSVSPATGPLERSYAKLAKICYKDRNALHSKKCWDSLFVSSSANRQ